VQSNHSYMSQKPNNISIELSLFEPWNKHVTLHHSSRAQASHGQPNQLGWAGALSQTRRWCLQGFCPCIYTLVGHTQAIGSNWLHVGLGLILKVSRRILQKLVEGGEWGGRPTTPLAGRPHLADTRSPLRPGVF
jgi:hypothetical protein